MSYFFVVLQFVVVRVLPKVPEEGGGTGMGTQKLVQDIPAPVLAIVPARGSHTGTARHRPLAVGCRVRHNGTGRKARRTAVQHCHLSCVCVPGRMGFPHAHPARSRRYAAGRHVLPERWFYSYRGQV